MGRIKSENGWGGGAGWLFRGRGSVTSPVLPYFCPHPESSRTPAPSCLPSPSPAPPRPPPLPGSDITGRPGGVRRRRARAQAPRAEEAAAAAAEAAAAAGAEEEAPDAAQEPGTPECPLPERSAPEAALWNSESWVRKATWRVKEPSFCQAAPITARLQLNNG